MRLAFLIAAILTLGFVWSAPVPSGPEVPQALAATADACPEQDEEGDAEEAQHVTKSGDPAGSGDEGSDEESSDGGEEESDEDAPPKFSNSFHRRWFSMDASTDGFETAELPVSIEAVCDLPARLQKEGDQLNGTDGVAVVSSSGTRIVKDGKRLTGTTGTAELEGADTAFLKVRLFRPNNWREDEDGNKIPTFRARRIAITD